MKLCQVRRQVYKVWEFTNAEEFAREPIPGVYMCEDGEFYCTTQRGVINLEPGDVVILGEDHALDVVKPEAFKQCFQEIPA